MDGKNKAKTQPTKIIRKQRSRKFKKKPKKYHVKKLNCDFIGVTIIRTHSESNRTMSANKRVLRAVMYCMLVDICGRGCLREKNLVPGCNTLAIERINQPKKKLKK